jgi:hypothetical protein
MEERVVSLSVFEAADLARAAVQAAEPVQTIRETAKWSPENFAREQIRGLVRQVFFSSVAHQVRQVVFCPAGSGTDVGNICWQVAAALAVDTSGNVAVVSRARLAAQPDQANTEENALNVGEDATPLRQVAIRMRRNLWWVPQNRLVEEGGVSGAPLSSRLCELRREFEYSIVQGPAAGESGEAAALGQSADGIILVLAAHVTHRAAALNIKETLDAAQVRLLGTVLSERRFPIPEAVYRRL